jgi:putative SOS response-associated peptidase YedK
MCNLYRLEKSPDAVRKLFADVQVRLLFPEGVPNFEPREIRITDQAPIVRSSDDPSEAELVQRRWSWPAPGGKPVYNFRSEGRTFGSGRCLILADGFYEFTPHTDPKSKRKHKWLFTLKDAECFAIAGLIRSTPETGEAFTMLTTEPGADVAPYHSRQIVVLPSADWPRWLDPSADVHDLLRPLPAGSLEVAQVA